MNQPAVAASWRGRRRLALAGLIVSIACLASGLVLAVINLRSPGAPPLDGNGVSGAFMALTYGGIGWLVASRQPQNAVGWILMTVGLAEAVETFTSSAAVHGQITAPGSIPYADILVWLALWAWVPGYSLVVTFALLLFPDGRLPSRRWRPVAALTAIGLLMVGLPIMVSTWPLRGRALITTGDVNGIPELAQQVEGIGGLLIAVAALMSVASVIVRFRRSRGLERQQLKWFGVGASVTILWLVLTAFVTVPPLEGVVTAIIFVPLLPASMAIAILRYRLFDIDRIISRTIGWLAVTGILAAVFVGGVLLAQAVLEPVTGGSTIGVAAATLVAAALFAPVRSRVQRAVDRRFNRARYDAERTAAGFAARLRDDVDLDSVGRELRDVIDRTVAPASLGMWLRDEVIANPAPVRR